MKKFTLTFVILFLSISLGFSQANLVVEAPLNNLSTSVNRGPNGTSAHAFVSGCYFVSQAELANITVGTSITSFGFTLTAGVTAATSGNFTVYLQHTNDPNYQKGTNFTTAVASMTTAYSGVLNLPLAGTTSVVVTLSTPITYTGGAMYVAYNWTSTGPFTGTASYLGELNNMPLPVGGGGIFTSAVAAVPTLTLTNARPSFLFGYANPNTNDINVATIEAPSKIAVTLNTPHQVRALVRNISNIAKSNIVVNFNSLGANTFNANQTIPSLAAGASTVLTFSGFNPQSLGVNTLSVSVASDQNNLNNFATYSQTVTCNRWSNSPPGTYTNSGIGFAGASGIIANAYTTATNASLLGIRGAIGATTLVLNQTVCAAILDASGSVIAMTNTLTVTNTILYTFQDFFFSAPVNLTANTVYYFGLVQIGIINGVIGTLTTNFQTPNFISYVGNVNGGALTALATNLGYTGIEGIYGDAQFSLSANPPVVCVGNCAVVTAPSTINNYTWSSGANTSSISACPASIFNNTYSVTGTTTLGCPATGSIAVGVNQLPNVTIASTSNSICVGGTITFTANGASSYSLNGVSTTSDVTQSPSANTIYTITGIDANTCTNTVTFNVSIETLTVTVTSNTAICKGKNITLNASGQSNYNYNWNTGTINIPISGISVTPTITSTYTLTTTDGYCTIVTPVTVTVNPVPTVTLSSNKPVICKGESVTISGNSAGTYAWNNNNSATTASISVSPSLTTTYNATVTNVTGCSVTAVFSQVVLVCTSINDASAVKSVICIYPNPNNGSFVISTDNIEITKTIEIYNAIGSVVKRVELNATPAQVDLTQEANGIYFVKIIENNKTVQVSKIVKQ